MGGNVQGKLRALAREATACRLEVVGEGTFKEGCDRGGASLDAVRGSTLEAAAVPGLYLAGEVLDIDGITGGYNFLNAWATSWCAGTAIADDAEGVWQAGQRTGGDASAHE